MRQYEPCIEIIIIRKKKKIKTKIKKKSQKETGEGERLRERNFIFFLSSFLSKIYENRTVGFRWSRRQSRSMYRELRVGTKILAFSQTSRGREFSYLCYFYPKGI